MFGILFSIDENQEHSDFGPAACESFMSEHVVAECGALLPLLPGLEFAIACSTEVQEKADVSKIAYLQASSHLHLASATPVTKRAPGKRHRAQTSARQRFHPN